MRWGWVVGLALLAGVGIRAWSGRAVEAHRLALRALLDERPREQAFEIGGRYFTVGELRTASAERLVGPGAERNPGVDPPYDDPVPVIADFRDRLAEIGVDLWVLPAPVRPWVAPSAVRPSIWARPPAPAYSGAYRGLVDALRAEDVTVIDVLGRFQAGALWDTSDWIHATDPHWTGRGVVAAARILARRVQRQAWAADVPRIETMARWRPTKRAADFGGIAVPPGTPDEVIALRRVRLSAPTFKDAPRLPIDRADAPILVIGDSHVRWYEEFDADLPRQMVYETGGIPVDTLPIVGGGATRVREELVRRYWDDPTYLTKRRVVLWVFWAEIVQARTWRVVPLDPFDASKLAQRDRAARVESDTFLLEEGRGPVRFDFRWTLPAVERGEDTAWVRKPYGAALGFSGEVPKDSALVFEVRSRAPGEVGVKLDGVELGTLQARAGYERFRFELPAGVPGDRHEIELSTGERAGVFGLRTLILARSARVFGWDGAQLAAVPGFSEREGEAVSPLRAEVDLPLEAVPSGAILRIRVRSLAGDQAMAVSVNGGTVADALPLTQDWSEHAVVISGLVAGDNRIAFEVPRADRSGQAVVWDLLEIDRSGAP